MPFLIYFLVSADYRKTYVGFSDNINRRIKEHAKGLVKTTKNFGKFRCFDLEEVADLFEARRREKYWKSHAGRNKLIEIYKKI